MKIVVSGASGFIGSWLVCFLELQGHQVSKLVRSRIYIRPQDIFWNPDESFIEHKKFEEILPDAVIHLSGENVVGIWTENKKRAIRESRIVSTKFLSDIVLSLSRPPSVFICASGINFYGCDTNNEFSDETWVAPRVGSGGFLCEVVKEWEEATYILKTRGIRVVNLRLGAVLQIDGGLISSLIVPMKLGIGGVIGSGTQWISWISMRDVLRAIAFLLINHTIEGPVNMVSPNPITNYDMTKTIGRLLWRPTLMWIPTPVVKALSYSIVGDFANETLLASIKVFPKKLLDAEFRFTDVSFETTVKNILYFPSPINSPPLPTSEDLASATNTSSVNI
jgi:uncharacterized protein (TIGR01777 family)